MLEYVTSNRTPVTNEYVSVYVDRSKTDNRYIVSLEGSETIRIDFDCVNKAFLLYRILNKSIINNQFIENLKNDL